MAPTDRWWRRLFRSRTRRDASVPPSPGGAGGSGFGAVGGAPPAPGARGSRAGGTTEAEVPRGLRAPGTPEERRFSQVYAEDRVGPMPYPNQASPDVAAARGRVRALVNDLLPGGVDEGTGAALDPLIASWASGWLARIDSEHADHHAVIDRLIGGARQQLADAEATHERDRRALEIARRDYADARERLMEPEAVPESLPGSGSGSGSGPEARPVPARRRVRQRTARPAAPQRGPGTAGLAGRAHPGTRRAAPRSRHGADPGQARHVRHHAARAGPRTVEPRRAPHRADGGPAMTAGTPPGRGGRRPGRFAPAAPVPRSYRDSTMLINRSREDFLALGIIILAIGGDIAAFYVVLARVFRGSTFLIVIGTVGFAAASVGLAHLVGQGLARRRCGDPRASATLTVLALGVWLVLGVASFVTRLLTPSTTSSDPFGSSSGGFGSSSGRVRVLLRRLRVRRRGVRVVVERPGALRGAARRAVRRALPGERRGGDGRHLRVVQPGGGRPAACGAATGGGHRCGTAQPRRAGALARGPASAGERARP